MAWENIIKQTDKYDEPSEDVFYLSVKDARKMKKTIDRDLKFYKKYLSESRGESEPGLEEIEYMIELHEDLYGPLYELTDILTKIQRHMAEHW